MGWILAACLAAAAPAGVTVPFAWTPGQIEVAVTVNGTPATFVLDTGSEYSVVSTRLAQQLHLTLEPRGVREFADGVRLGIGPLEMTDQRVMVMPFDTYYARGRRIDGLIGYDVFDRFTVKIDWTARTLTFWERDAFTPPAAAVDVPIAFAGRLPVIAGALRLGEGRSLETRLMVDTGASQSIMLRHPFATRHALFALATRETSAPSLADGTRRLVEVPAEELSLKGSVSLEGSNGQAALTFDHPQVLAFTEPVGSAASTDTDGLIGNTLLSRFTLYVDYARKRLLLEPRPR